MAEATDLYALPLLQVAQAQKEVTHNEALAAIDTLLHLAVETRASTVPPVAPVAGQSWIVAAGATAAWAGREGQIAAFGSGGWRYVVPREGCVAWQRDVQRFAVRTTAGWRDDGWPAAGVRIGTRLVLAGGAPVIAAAAGGTVIDTEARALLVTLLASLRSNGLVA